MALTVADAAIALHADFKTFEREFAQGAAKADPLSQAAGRTAGQRFQSAFNPQAITRTFTAVGAVGGSLFAGAIGGAANFEDQLRTINTVAKLPEEALQGIGREIVALSGETGKTTDDLTAGFYDLVSAGVPAEKAIAVLRDSAKFASGALGTTAESVDLVTSAMNAYGLGADSSTRITDIFAKAVADGKITAAELGASIANIAPIAASAGVSLEEVSAGYALLTAKGVPAAQAATQMRASISALLTPNETLNRIQAETGQNFADIAREKGLAVALEELRTITAETGGEFDNFSQALFEASQDAGKNAGDIHDIIGEFRNNLGLTEDEAAKFEAAVGSKGMGEALAELGKKLGASDAGFAGALGSVEAYQFALATTGSNAEAMATQITESADAAGLAQEQYDEKSKSSVEQGKRMAATIKGLALQIGGPFVEGLGPAVIALNQMGGGLSGIFAASRLVGSGLGALAGRLIPGLLIQLGLMAPAAAAGSTVVGTAVAGGISLGMIALPVILLAALIAAILFLVNNPQIVGQIGAFVGSLLGAIGNFLSALPALLLGIFSAAFGAVVAHAPGFIGEVAKVILLLPFRIAGLAVDMLEFFAGILTSILGALPGFVADVVRFLFELPGKLVALGGEIVGAIINGMASLPGRLFSTIANAFRNLRIDVGPFHISASGVTIDLPNIQLPTFAVGSNFIPADMLAMVHRREIIVPAETADAIRAGRATLGVSGGPGGGGGNEGGSGGTTIINVPVQGLLPVRSPRDIVTELIRLQDVGILPAGRLSPKYRRSEVAG